MTAEYSLFPNKFVFSNYWRTWSRLLAVPANPSVYVASVVLTPINGFRDYTLANVQKETLHPFHGYLPKENIAQTTLPTLVRKEMEKHLGESLTKRLMTYEYLSEINAEEIEQACKKSNGGGVPLSFILSLREKPNQFWRWHPDGTRVVHLPLN